MPYFFPPPLTCFLLQNSYRFQFFIVTVWIWLHFGWKSLQVWGRDGCSGYCMSNQICKRSSFSYSIGLCSFTFQIVSSPFLVSHPSNPYPIFPRPTSLRVFCHLFTHPFLPPQPDIQSRALTTCLVEHQSMECFNCLTHLLCYPPVEEVLLSWDPHVFSKLMRESLLS